MQSGTVTATIYEAVCRTMMARIMFVPCRWKSWRRRTDCRKIYNYEIDENGFRQVTRSLHPYVAAVYGWKTLQDNLVQVKSL